jgi:hypothetical protein
MESIYHIVTIRVNETSWAHVWRLRSLYLGTGYDKRQSILVGLTKVCAALAPNMQFYFYIIDKKVMGTKWTRALTLPLCKEERGLLEGLVLEVHEERLRYNVT